MPTPFWAKLYQNSQFARKQLKNEDILKTHSLIDWFQESKLQMEKAELTISITGKISEIYDLVMDTLKKNLTGTPFKEGLNMTLCHGQRLTITPEQSLSVKLSFKIKGNISQSISFFSFDVAKMEARFDAEGEEITSTLAHRRVNYYSSKGDSHFYHEIVFSGIKGKIFQKVEGRIDSDLSWDTDIKFDSNKQNKDIVFEWAPDKTFRSDPVPHPFVSHVYL